MAAFTPTTNPRPALASAVGPDETVLVASGTYTATAAQEFTIQGFREIVAVAITTSSGGTESTTPTIEYFDVAAQAWVVLLTGSAIAAASGTVILTFGPHAPTTANLSAPTALYRRMRINMTHGNGNNHGYTISLSAI
jgi:hypothetical protein